MQTRMIDIHPHVISTDTNRYPITPLGEKRSVWSQERPVTFEQYSAAMDQAGVAKAAIVHSSTTYGYDNSYLADCVALQPGRFTGVFSVDMLAADAPDKIRYWVGKGLSGLRLFTAGTTMDKQATWLDDPKSFAGWDCAAELGITVCVQMHQEGLPQLMAMIKKFPRVRMIIDHMMYPPVEEGLPYTGSNYLFDLSRYENIHLKLTTHNTRAAMKGKGTPESFFPLLVNKFGASRIAWGSNFPAVTGTLAEIVQEAKTVLSVLTPEEQDWIFYRTAQSLYPALADK